MAAMIRRRLHRDQWLDPRYNLRVRLLDAEGQVLEQRRADGRPLSHWGHNIFLNVGRLWLLRHMSPNLTAPNTITPGASPPPPLGWYPPYGVYPGQDGFDRISFIAVGAGGREQITRPAVWPPPTGSPFWDAYQAKHVLGGAPGFAYDDTDVTITGLEIPLVSAVLGGSVDRYAKSITLVEFDPGPASITWVKYTALFGVADLDGVYGKDVPVSEVAIYPSFIKGGLVDEPDRSYVMTQAIAYEAFPTITKPTGTPGVQLEVQWMFRL